MTETSYTVFENHEVRKTKQQKTAFIAYVQEVAEKNGYTCQTERGSFGARNIVVGDPDHAKVVYTAHYDTCARLPFPNFITPKCFAIYLLYQIVVTVGFMLLPAFLVPLAVGVCMTLCGLADAVPYVIAPLVYAVMIAFFALIMFGPANKHTANDNTSGVTVLLDLMTSLPDEQKAHAAFVFFDLEELGLFGSAGFAKKHKEAMKNKLLINFDCVSDGEHILFTTAKKSRQYAAQLREIFPSTDKVETEVTTHGVFYPSDQSNFPCGVGVAALKRSRRFGLLYMNRIHTKRDTVYREENIAYLVQGCIALTAALSCKNVLADGVKNEIFDEYGIYAYNEEATIEETRPLGKGKRCFKNEKSKEKLIVQYKNMMQKYQ